MYNILYEIQNQMKTKSDKTFSFYQSYYKNILFL